MAPLTSLAMADLSEAIADVTTALASDSAPERADTLKRLRSLHESLIRSTRGIDEPPVASLADAAEATRPVADDVVDALSPRPRTVFRLLRADALLAAWEVLIDNGTGLVEEAYAASTATGAARTSPRLPLLTRIESGVIYAELPGFRDPRFSAPDQCYDITGVVGLKIAVDELITTGTSLTMSGWAALDILTATETERVSVVLTAGDRTIVLPGSRVRRSDLVNGRGESLTRRAWAGFSVTADLATIELMPGDWRCSIEVDHDGVAVRQPIGREVSDLAIAGTLAPIPVGATTIRWETSKKHWALVVV